MTDSKHSKKWIWWSIVSSIVLFIYIFPRILVSTMGPASPWTNYLYQYGFGSLVFIVGMVLILKTKACVPGRGNDSFWLKFLIFGFFFYALGHLAWILAALYT